jgi:hypothetical protein
MIADYVYPAIIGIIAALATNIIFFEHRFYKEKQSNFLKIQIDELLLPLYIKMKQFEGKMEFNRDLDVSWEMIIEDDADIKKIAIEKLNFANKKLSKLLLDFINYRYLNDGIRNVESDIVVENFLELKQEVFNEYEQKVEEYQNMKPWWHF